MAATLALDGNQQRWFEEEHLRRPFSGWRELRDKVSAKDLRVWMVMRSELEEEENEVSEGETTTTEELRDAPVEKKSNAGAVPTVHGGVFKNKPRGISSSLAGDYNCGGGIGCNHLLVVAYCLRSALRVKFEGASEACGSGGGPGLQQRTGGGEVVDHQLLVAPSYGSKRRENFTDGAAGMSGSGGEPGSQSSYGGLDGGGLVKDRWWCSKNQEKNRGGEVEGSSISGRPRGSAGSFTG